MPLLLLFQQVPDAVLAEDATLQMFRQLAPFVGLVVPEPLAAEVVIRQLPGDLPRGILLLTKRHICSINNVEIENRLFDWMDVGLLDAVTMSFLHFRKVVLL